MSDPSISFYSIGTDPDRYQYFLFADDEEVDYVSAGQTLRDTWRPPEVYSLHPRLEEPDFWNFGLGACGAVWAIRPEAFARVPELEHFLLPSGELLPLDYQGREFLVFNVTDCVDALDKERTAWAYYDDGSVADAEEPVFRHDRLSEQIFKVPETAITQIYCYENDDDREDQFRHFVEISGLTGLVFTPIPQPDDS